MTISPKDFRTDRETYLPSPVINPSSLGPAGWWFIDGLSGVKITRLTDDKDGAGFGTTYSIWPTANRDNTRLYMLNVGVNTYYTAEFDPSSGTRIGPLKPVAPIGARHFANHESALWSGSDPDKLFMFVDAKLYFYRPSTGTYHVVKDLTPILGADYSFRQQHKSADDRRFAASGPQGFVVYDVEQDRVLLDVRTSDMNGIALDRSGKWLLYVPDDDHIEYVYNVETGAREELRSDRNTGLPDFTAGHLDVGMDIIAGNDRWGGAITARKFSAPHAFTRPFVYAPTGWISHHVSMTAADENWALLSTYGENVGPRDVSGQPIKPFDPDKFKDECFQIGIQGEAAGKVRRLFHHRVIADKQDFASYYWKLPKANVSRDGRFVFFTSNMGGSRNDLYVADLGQPSSPTPTPQPLPTPPEPPKPTEPPPPTVPEPPTGPVPAVTLISPTNGATLSGKATVTATVTAAIEVYLIIDDVVRGAMTGTPHEFQVDTTKLPEGNHSLYVRAWSAAGKSGDSAKITVKVVNAPVIDPSPPPPVDPPPVEPPLPPPTKPCSLTAPASIDIPRNSSRDISIRLDDLIEPTTVTASGSNGQVSVSPLSKIASPTSAILSFRVRVKNKRMSRILKFSCACGEREVRVNIT